MHPLAVIIWDRVDVCIPGYICATQEPFIQNLHGGRETLISSPDSIPAWSVLTQGQQLPQGKI